MSIGADRQAKALRIKGQSIESAMDAISGDLQSFTASRSKLREQRGLTATYA